MSTWTNVCRIARPQANEISQDATPMATRKAPKNPSFQAVRLTSATPSRAYNANEHKYWGPSNGVHDIWYAVKHGDVPFWQDGYGTLDKSQGLSENVGLIFPMK